MAEPIANQTMAHSEDTATIVLAAADADGDELTYAAELVGRNPDGSLTADQGQTARARFEALRRGWVTITRPWHLLTTNAGAANPHAATAEKGRRLMEVLVERLAGFLVELSEAELDERFPY